jgi:hypothetical protein
MGFSAGNQSWKLRTSHGRKGRFVNPVSLWEAATEYFEWADSNPWKKIEQANKPVAATDGTLSYLVELPVARPYTLSGLCSFWKVNQAYWRKFRKSKSDDESFAEVISRIEDVIYVHKFEGAVIGAFNVNIIMRDLGLLEKKQAEQRTVVTVRRDQPNGDIVLESAID